VKSDVDPSYEDSVKVQLNMIRDRAIADPLSFPQLAEKFSEDKGSRERGGNLGYIMKGALIEEFKEIVENLEIGEISEVFQSKMGFHIMLLEGEDDDGYRLRHIMMKAEPSLENVEVTRREAEDLRESLLQGEKDFVRTSQEYSRGDEEEQGEQEWFTHNEMTSEIRDAVLKLKEGEISPPVETDDGFYIVRLLEIRSNQTKPLGEAESYITEALKAEKVKDVLQLKLNELRKDTYIKVYLSFNK
jgi:peptidyl-prolyl cis-trans isomerase SurA